MIKNRIIAGICILFGVVMLAIPFFYHFKGTSKTEKLLEDFTEAVEEEQDEETADEKEEQTTISEADASIFAEGDVSAILEIEELGMPWGIVGVGGAVSAWLAKSIMSSDKKKK